MIRSQPPAAFNDSLYFTIVVPTESVELRSFVPIRPARRHSLFRQPPPCRYDDVRITQSFRPRSNDEMDAIRVHASMKYRKMNFGPNTILDVGNREFDVPAVRPKLVVYPSRHNSTRLTRARCARVALDFPKHQRGSSS